MTIIHRGVRRKTTDVLDDYGQAFYAQNWRFKRVGEIGRRPGIGKSTMARLTGPVRSMICGNLFFPYLVQVNDTGDVNATLDPLAYWGDPLMKIPDGQVGQAAAPVINSMDMSPASGVAYPAGFVTCTANITYDGLSGPLIYNWINTGWAVYPNQPPIPQGGADNTYTWEFVAGCIPGTYSFSGFPSLQVDTTLNGFTVFGTISDYVVS